MRCLLVLLSLPVVALAVLMAYIFTIHPILEPITPPAPGWWGKGEPHTEDNTIRPFIVNASKEAITDLRKRVQATRFGSDLEDGSFHYGFQVDYMKKVRDHWLSTYSWKKTQDELNKYPQFTTQVEGIKLHFMRIKPKKVQKDRVLLLLHGWPGSVWEFMKIIPMLTEPEKFGGNAADAFEVICPSLPGFGFSGAPKKTGFGLAAMARVSHTLMLRLGHDQFYVQGGDWGSIISTMMTWLYPGNIIGLHINMITIPMAHPQLKLHQMAAFVAPSVFLPEEDLPRLPSWEDYIRSTLVETGYMHIQATKPDTVAMGLNDSPVGLAAYILEKFSTWTDPANRDSRDGAITAHYLLDDVLANVMIYWLNGNIGSSMRLYKEAFADPVYAALQNYPVNVPTGISLFPHELFPVPETYAAYRYQHILQFTDMPKGGHFAAMEQPKLLAEDIMNFVKKVQQLEEIVPES